MIAILRIAGQCGNVAKDNETLNRLKLRKKFTCALIADDDKIKIGMAKSVRHMVAYGKISDELAAQIKEKRKETNGIFFMHPPRGGFKKSSKVAFPKGILGHNKELDKLLERML